MAPAHNAPGPWVMTTMSIAKSRALEDSVQDIRGTEKRSEQPRCVEAHGRTCEPQPHSMVDHGRQGRYLQRTHYRYGCAMRGHV